MIYDVFPFFNELELLEVRLHELSSIVGHFVIAESPMTHSGKPKPLYYQENRDRFKEFADRITHVVVPLPTGNDHWLRENQQRNELKTALSRLGATSNDLIISSDLDELPRAAALAPLLSSINRPRRMVMKGYYHFVNKMTGTEWRLGIITPFRCIDCTLSQLRDSGAGHESAIDDCGWHFSYMGGHERVSLKLDSFAHQEHNNEQMRKDHAQWAAETDCSRVSETGLPQYLLANRAKFPHLFLQV